LFILHKTQDGRVVKEKDRILNYILNNVLSERFEFKKGNTLASLAEALTINFEGFFVGSVKPQYESIIGNKIYYPSTEIFQSGTFTYASELYIKIVRVLSKLVHFYRYYFDYYLPQKKVVVISLFSQLRLYDEKLFTNFIKQFDQLI
jgi:hypothetical protein